MESPMTTGVINYITEDIVYQIVRELCTRDISSFAMTCKSVKRAWKKIMLIAKPIIISVPLKERQYILKNHNYLRNFGYHLANDHTSFIFSAYVGDQCAVTEYLTNLSNNSKYDIVNYSEVLYFTHCIPLADNILYRKILSYMTLLLKFAGNYRISTVRLACHAACLGKQFNVFLRLLNIMYPSNNICPIDENIRISDSDIIGADLDWDLNIALNYALETDDICTLNYFLKNFKFKLNRTNLVLIYSKGYVGFLKKNTTGMSLAEFDGNLELLMLASEKKKFNVLDWYLEKYSTAINNSMNSKMGYSFFKMYLNASDDIIDWWEKSGIFREYIIIGNVLKYFNNHRVSNRLSKYKAKLLIGNNKIEKIDKGIIIAHACVLDHTFSIDPNFHVNIIEPDDDMRCYIDDIISQVLLTYRNEIYRAIKYRRTVKSPKE